jgi:hypothetical protein
MKEPVMTKLVEQDATHIVEEDNIRQPPLYREDGPPQVVTADTARQGPLGAPVLWVLVGALVLAGVAWLVVRMFV